MRILLTNDDGIYAPGIAAIRNELTCLGEVTIAAPDVERSAVGHSITLHRPLRVREVYVRDAFLGYAVDGSPADCVKIGIKEILPERPDLIVSGINLGSNVGINILYSGTVAAALEGAILGYTSVSVSLETSKRPDFESAARVASNVIKKAIEKNLPAGSLLNVNVPACQADEFKGVIVARQSTVSYDDGFVTRTDPRGGTYFWMTGELEEGRLAPDTDSALLARGFVTVTPLQFDLTSARLLEIARDWKFEI